MIRIRLERPPQEWIGQENRLHGLLWYKDGRIVATAVIEEFVEAAHRDRKGVWVPVEVVDD